MISVLYDDKRTQIRLACLVKLIKKNLYINMILSANPDMIDDLLI